MLETRTLLAAVIWEGGVDLSGDGTSWNDPHNWVGDTLPGDTDDVVIGAGFGGIVHSGGSDTVNSITSDSPVTQSGGTLTVSTTADISSSFSLAGGVLANASTSSGTTITVDGGGTLSNVVLNGDLDVATTNGASVYVLNGLTLNGRASVGRVDGGTVGFMYFAGTQTIGGTGNIVFGGHFDNRLYIVTAGAAVTLGSSLTVHGANGYMNPHYSDSSFVNQGTIACDVAGGRIDIGSHRYGYEGNAGSLVNEGTLAASNNGGLHVHPETWSSTGAVSATSGGFVALGNNGGSNSGPITASGGTVTLDGNWTSSGVITASGGGLVSINGNRTNSGSISAASGGAVDINRSWTNDSPLSASSGGAINFNGTWSNSAVPTLAGGILNLRGSGTWSASTLQGDATSAVNVYGVFTTAGSNLDVLGGLVHLLGGTMVNGTMNIAAAARLEFSGGVLDNFTITNNGAATWTSGNVTLTNGSAFNNACTFRSRHRKLRQRRPVTRSPDWAV